MVHKIHRGINLPTIAAATVAETDASYRSYAVTTGGVATGVAFPQDIRNCTNCHVGEDDKQNNLEIAATATKDGDNWKQFPTIEACGSCHDDMAWNDDMLTVQGTRKHEALFPATNEDCSTCHVGNDLWYEVEKVHTGAHKASIAAAALITFETTSVKQATNGFDFTVKVSKDGQQIGDYAQIEQYLKREVYVMFNWDNGDGYEASYFNNHVTFDTCLASPDSDDFICHWDSSSLNDGQAITTGTGVFTFADALSCIDHNTNQLIDCDATDDNGDALEIALVPLPLSISHYDMSTLTTTENYENKFAADLASCKSCHSADMNIHATRHGASDFTQCTSCHNATRAAFYSGRPADLKYQVHKLHASNDPGGHGVIKFPAELNNCQQCHSEGQIDLPLAQNPRASKTNNPAATGDVFTSPTAVVCTTCHIAVTPGYINTAGQIVKDADGNFFKAADGSDIKLTDVEQNIINHMILAGGAAFGAPTAEAATGTEACATCHAIGSVVGVDKVHGLND
jgi:OmcA/MtrC family decaheme c-type cytochrome